MIFVGAVSLAILVYYLKCIYVGGLVLGSVLNFIQEDQTG